MSHRYAVIGAGGQGTAAAYDLAKNGEKGVCIIHAKAVGESQGKHASAIVDLFDHFDDTTGFTAMERTTGWHAAIMASLMAHGEVAKGAVPVERGMKVQGGLELAFPV